MKGTTYEKEKRRRLAVSRVLEGWRQRDIAEALGVSERSVQRWMKAYRDSGDAGLAARPVPGAPRKLTPRRERSVLSWLERSPTEFGFPTELWTAGRVAELIRRKFGVRFHPRYLNQWLARRRITSQKPQRQPRERDPEKIRRWLLEDWLRIQARMQGEKAHLVMIDESGLQMAPLVKRTLARRGRRPVLKVKGAHRERVSLVAALAISPVLRHLELHFRSFPRGTVNNERAADFLRQLLRRIRGPVIVVWDGGPMHKGDPIRELQRRFPRLTIERLPPYAPDLNPVEHLWKHLKYDKLCNYLPTDVFTLDRAATRQLQATQSDPSRLRSFLRATPLVETDPTLVI